MRLDNHNLASLEAYEPLTPEGEPLSADGHGDTPDGELICVCQKPSALLSEMARNPPVLLQQPPPPPLSPPPPSLGQGPDRRIGGAGDGSSGGRGSDLAPAPAEAPAEAPAAPAPVPAPVAVAAPPATQPPPSATAVPTTDPTPLPLGPVVSAEWLTQREAALGALRTDFEASREAARSAPPADVASAAPGWVAAPTDNDGLPVPGAVWVPDSGDSGAPADPYGGQPAFLFRRDTPTMAPAGGQWLTFDDGTYEQHYRDHLASRASAPLAQLYGEPAQDLFARHPDLWTLATQAHALNAGPPPRPGLAMGSVDQLGPLDLYLADTFITQLRTQLGGTPAAPTSGLALEQQRLYGPQRYAELTQLDQALAAVRSEHAAAQQAAYAGGGIGWIDVPMQFGTDPETGQPTGVYATTGDGEVQRDANGVPVLATQRVFDEALFTNAWLADGERSGGLAQQAFARFYGHAHSQIVLQDDSRQNAGMPHWVSRPSLDNPHIALMPEGLWDGDLISLDLNHAPQLNNDAAVGFDPQLGWVTQRENLYEHRNLLEQAAPLALVAFVAWATAGAATAAGWGAAGSAAAAGAASSFASGVVNGNLSLKGVLIGAISGALTAGLTPDLTSALKTAGLGTTAAGIAARMTVQGGIQALLGGKFKDGAIAGFASGLADLASQGIEDSIEAIGTMSPADQFAARTFKTVLTSAITAAASPGDPAHAFASAWLSGMLNNNLPPVKAPAPAPATGVQTFPVPDPGPVEVVPLPVEPEKPAVPIGMLDGVIAPTGLFAPPSAVDEFTQRLQDGIEQAAAQADLNFAAYAAQRYEQLLVEDRSQLAYGEFGEPEQVAGPGGVRGAPSAMQGSGLRLNVNERARAAFDALSAPASDAFGLIPEAYRDIKFIAPLLQEQRLLSEAERMRFQLGQSGYDVTPEKLGVSRNIYGNGAGRYDAVDMVNRYADAVRLLDLYRQGVIDLDTRDFSVRSVGTARVPTQEFLQTVQERYREAFKNGYDKARATLASGQSLRYPADMPVDLQVGLAADDAGKNALSQYLFSIGSPEGPGQTVALNRWAYDKTGLTNRYVRPDVFIDLGTRQRTWLDGKSAYINKGVLPQQLFDFFQFTGSQAGTVITGSGGVIKIKPPVGGKKGP